MARGRSKTRANASIWVDPVERATLLARVRDAVLSGDLSDSGAHTELKPREVVSDSWRRALAARVDPARGAPLHVFEERELAAVRESHPLASVLPILRGTLLGVADEAMHIMIVTDASGHILWREGADRMLHLADDVELAEGFRWSEDSAGTNAMGTTLAAGSPVQIHSAEHLVAEYHHLTCAGAPIHDADSGEVVGAIDLTGPVHTFHPSSLALVSAAAKLAEHHLATRQAICDDRLLARNLPHLAGRSQTPSAILSPSGRVLAATPQDWLGSRVDLPSSGDRVRLGDYGEAVLEALPEGWLLRQESAFARWTRPNLALQFLGASRPVARLDGRPIRLGERHAELLALLAAHPEGLSASALALELYGDSGNPVTVRAEMHRLRSLLESDQKGATVVRTGPYRLDACVDADFLTLLEAVNCGRLPGNELIRRGQLLPSSDAPGIRALRSQLDVRVRSVVLRSGDTGAMWALAGTLSGCYDAELIERLRYVLPVTDPRHAELFSSAEDEPLPEW